MSILSGNTILASDFPSTSPGAITAGSKAPSLNAKGILDDSFCPPYIIDSAHLASGDKHWYSDTFGTILGATSSVLCVEQLDYPMQKRTYTSDWASAGECSSIARIGAYIYALYRDSSNNY